MNAPSRGGPGFGAVGRLLREPLDDTLDAMALALEDNPVRGGVLIAVGVIATWFVYVPVHELLHVAGCLVTGGTVTELELDPVYGGTLLARVFPFVTPGGEYAGRLSGFDTGGSDLVYLATDLGPYLLSIGIGVPLLVACTRRARPLLLGPAVVLALAPLYNVPGDYFEMASIVITRAAASIVGAGDPPHFEALRSDDVARLITAMFDDPESLGLEDGGDLWVAAALVVSSIALAILLAFLSYRLGSLLARRGRTRPIAAAR